MTERVTGWLDARAEYLPAAARDTLRGLVAGAPPDRLPRQLVHFDFRSANILCAGGEVTAVIDFEEARHDHRLVELASSAVLLGTRYHNWGPVPAEVRTELLAGYQGVRPLTPAEAGWLDILLLWQPLAMVPPGDDPTGWGPSALSQLPRPLRPGAAAGDAYPLTSSASNGRRWARCFEVLQDVHARELIDRPLKVRRRRLERLLASAPPELVLCPQTHDEHSRRVFRVTATGLLRGMKASRNLARVAFYPRSPRPGSVAAHSL